MTWRPIMTTPKIIKAKNMTMNNKIAKILPPRPFLTFLLFLEFISFPFLFLRLI